MSREVKKYLYHINLGDYESPIDVFLETVEILTNNQFEGRVHQATRTALEYAVEHWDEFFWNPQGGITMDSLFDRILKELERLSLKEIRPKATWSGLGYVDVTSSGKESYRTAEMEKLIGSLPKSLNKKARSVSRDYHKKQTKND